MICKSDEQRPIGTIGLDSIDFSNQRAEVGNVLIGDPEFLGRGYASEALGLLMAFAFFHLNMNRLYLHVYNDNAEAVELYQRCGFVKEGILREHYFSNGGFRDVLVMGILRRDFRGSFHGSEKSD